MTTTIHPNYNKSFGSNVYDIKTERHYLDFMNHYSSLALGYDRMPQGFYLDVTEVCHVKTALGIYNPPPYIEFLKEFKEFAVPDGYTGIHFACTGSLAVEAAIKTAWCYAHDMKRRIVTLRNNFHGLNGLGNFVTTRSVNDTRLWGVPNAIWASDVSSLKQLKEFVIQLRDDVAAVIIEPVQCTNGDIYYDEIFFKEVRQLCDDENVVLIFDEIQTGFGVTGKLWYHQHVGIEPDIIVFGKKAQVSGIMVKEKFNKIFKYPEKLSVTYDGELIDCIRSKYIMREIKKRNLFQNMVEAGLQFLFALPKIENIKNVRGLGGLIAFDLESETERNIFQASCKEHGLLVNTAGEKTIRLRPHLAVTENEISNCIEIIKNVINKIYL